MSELIKIDSVRWIWWVYTTYTFMIKWHSHKLSLNIIIIIIIIIIIVFFFWSYRKNFLGTQI